MAGINRWKLAGLAAACVCAISAGSRQSDALGSVIVRQVDRMFVPARLSIPRGTPVIFTNDESVVHHAYIDAPDTNMETGDIAPGASATLRFDKDGLFIVRCAIHPRMRLEVEVMP